MMMPPCFSFHSQTRSRNFSRPRSCLVMLLFFSVFLDLHLGGDAGVVGARQPEHFFAVHARLAGEDVLDRVIEHVAHVEHAGDVRRRNDDGISRALGRDARRVGDKATAAPARTGTICPRPLAVRRLSESQTY